MKHFIRRIFIASLLVLLSLPALHATKPLTFSLNRAENSSHNDLYSLDSIRGTYPDKMPKKEITKPISAHTVKSSQPPSNCKTPKPFRQLSPTDARKYNFNRIISSLENSDKETKTIPIKQTVKTTNQTTIMNFWAIWCAPCRTELPLLEAIGKQQLANIQLVNIGDDVTSVKQLLDELKIISLPNLIAESNLLSQLSLMGLPATIVWSKSSVYLGMGKLNNKKALEQWLKCLDKPSTIEKSTIGKETQS